MPSRSTPRWAAPGLLLLAGLAVGCTSFEELRTCGEVIDTMNPLMAEIQSDGGSKSPTPTFVRLQATRYRAVADALSEIHRGPASLTPRITALMGEFRRIALTLDDAALARENDRLDQYLSARARLDSSRARLLDLKRQLARRCSR